MPTLSVVVPATDAPGTLDRCRRAILAASGPPDELIVVDGPPGLSPAAARNAGVRQARGEVVVFVDSDVEVHGDAFTRLRTAFEASPGVIAVFGFLNRFNDTMATPLEDEPAGVAAKHIAQHGWKLGKHASDKAASGE